MTWLHTYQTLIVGGLGFAGVIVTLLVNARQTRKLRREERQHECQTLRVALLEELKINKKAFVSNREDIQNKAPAPGGGYAMPLDPIDDAYREFIHRIGLLSQAEVGKVMNAYLTLRTYHTALLFMGTPLAPNSRHIRVPVEYSQGLAALLDGLIGPIDEAVGTMERARDAGSGRRRIWPKVLRRQEATADAAEMPPEVGVKAAARQLLANSQLGSANN
jgi:hypothetical protein